MKSRTALVTGASAGIGREIARVLAERRFDLVLVARRRERLEELAAELRDRHGATVLALPADLADPEAPARLQSELADRDIPIDVLVNNAGYAVNGCFTETPWATQRDFLRVLSFAVMELTHRFVPPMKERGWGRVLNVASVAAFVPERPGDVYGPVKRFVVSASRALAMELDGTGVTVTALCPGYTRTEFHQAMGVQEAADRMPDWLWDSAESVARDGVNAMMKGRAVHVTGRLYRVVVWLLRLVPRWLVYALAPKQVLERRGATDSEE